MTVYRLPERLRAFLLDIDGTLYTHEGYGRHQSEVLIAELARTRGKGYAEAEADVRRVRARYADANGGASTSLGNAMAALGVSIAQSVEWRARLIDPYRFLKADPALRTALLALASLGDGGPASIVAVTNNPRSVGEATLEALGVGDLFSRVVGLDDTMLSKPAPEPYLLAAEVAGAAPSYCVSVGDRYDVDLAAPLGLGMGAVLVSGAEDVYALPSAIVARRATSAP
ncbi:MAG: HAD family hydrolase [Spirochaetes bacterium]|nr:HAD family hydrolase [Spirochaetota bacterium]